MNRRAIRILANPAAPKLKLDDARCAPRLPSNSDKRPASDNVGESLFLTDLEYPAKNKIASTGFAVDIYGLTSRLGRQLKGR